MKKFLITIVVVVAIGGVWLGARSNRVQFWWSDFTKPKLPAAENAANQIANRITNNVTNAATNSTTVNTNSVVLPAEKNLAIPFTTQAPGANWDADHEEFCEEAAMLMVARFYQQRDFAGTADQEAGLQAIKKWEVDNLGFYFDTTAAENARILEELFNLHVELIVDPTITQIKTALAAGHPVIVPAAGRELGNPNFKSPGPIYHNLVIRGYTKNGKFITNDPGTRKGEEYIYDQSVIMSAMHDWVPEGARTIAANGDASGRKVVLVVEP